MMTVQELIELLQKLPSDFTVGQLTPYGNFGVDIEDIRASEIGIVFDAEGWGVGLDIFQPIEQWLEDNANG